jgi:hypothetical protein
MFSDDAQLHSSPFYPSESKLRFRMMLVELLWREWFETMSQVAYQTHRACEFFVQKWKTDERALWTFRFVPPVQAARFDRHGQT